MKNFLSLIRVEQWAKNLFLFMPVFFAARFGEIAVVMQVILAFFIFSFVASSVYIINDYMDIESDRLHPRKRHRPLASGAMHKNQALLLMGVLLIAAGGLSLFISLPFLMIIVAYFVMNLAYTFSLKHIAIIDVCIIAIGFLFRIFAGGEAADVPISKWLVMLTFLLAMILALGKRRGEFLVQEKEGKITRKSLEGYNLNFIDSSMLFIAAVTVVAYLMYTVSDEVVSRIGSDYIYFTTIFVILGIMRYLQQTLVYKRTESPTRVLYKDHFIQLILLLWIATFAYLLYF